VRRDDVLTVLGEDARPAAVELRQRHEVLLADARRRRGHRTPVELLHAAGDGGAAAARQIEAAAVAPGIRAEKQATLRREPFPEASRRQHERRFGVRWDRRAELDVACEQLGERARVEALAGRAWILGVLPDGLRAERDEP